jgi:basic amino acid/polyamine antiporter, APA family
MADNKAPEMQATLGLTGLTMNAMALIAPGAFLWLTFFIQATAGNTTPAMWAGIVLALLLCLATAVCYAELAKLYPGTGSSYYFAEQSFLNHDTAWKYARLSKFIVGWGSHLYYWVYPGVMCAVMGVLCGYLAGQIWPNFMNASLPGPVFMALIAIATAFLVAWIAYNGVNGSTSVNIAINVIQISALLIFSFTAVSYRMNHPPGTVAWNFDSNSGQAFTYEFATETQTVDGKPTDVISRDKDGNPKPKLDASGQPVPFKIDYPYNDEKGNFLSHGNAGSVLGMHNFAWMFVQATIAILILVGFESVTAMGGEAKNAKRDVPIAVITSLLVQGAFCYLIEYFCANYFLNNGYTMQSATGSAAPIGDMMIVIGNALFAGHGKAFMMIEAFTVFLAIIGTTLSCINTGARVTYAMGKDEELPDHYGMLHSENLTPHRSIWTLAVISAIVGVIAVSVAFGDGSAPKDTDIKALPQGLLSSVGYGTHDKMAALPNTLLLMTLTSNFGTFMLYGLSCVICIVGFHKHPMYNPVKHMFIPLFGVLANVGCMVAYLVLPFMGYGTKMEPFGALGLAAIWAIYGGIFFLRSSKASGRSTLVGEKSNSRATA